MLTRRFIDIYGSTKFNIFFVYKIDEDILNSWQLHFSICSNKSNSINGKKIISSLLNKQPSSIDDCLIWNMAMNELNIKNIYDGKNIF